VLATRRILAIFLHGPRAPVIPLQEAGLGGAVEALRVGMSRDELDRALADVDWQFGPLDDAEQPYRLYSTLGLAARVRQGRVVELAILQPPRGD
jgi:hypothetical protein